MTNTFGSLVGNYVLIPYDTAKDEPSFIGEVIGQQYDGNEMVVVVAKWSTPGGTTEGGEISPPSYGFVPCKHRMYCVSKGEIVHLPHFAPPE